MDVGKEVKAAIAKHLNVPAESLTDDTDLADAGLASLDFVEIIFDLEEKFGIELPYNANTTSTADFRTVGDVIRLVSSLVETRAA